MSISTRSPFNDFVVGTMIVATLYFSREILVPIALAVLLSFILAPAVRALQRLRLPRVVAVLCTVTTALAIAGTLAAMVFMEVNQLGSDLPRYQTTLIEKIHTLREMAGNASVLKNLPVVLKDLSKELDAPDRTQEPTAESRSNEPKMRIPVEVHQPDPGASATLVAVISPLIAPLTRTSIVVIFLTFFLFQREDLRDRFIRLVGSADLERTTAALDDAGGRLGRLLITQLILNAVFGIIIGSGLALIGVPSAPLWGFLSMILRFVPYIGVILAAALPIALASAVGSNWTMAIWTLALFAVVEPLTGQVIEPVVCGRSAGLSPVAIVVAASFWTWLWGPIGLVLSTPLTLCLVVLARHVERLQFIDVMLGDQPALTPQQSLYQRMLTGDPVEAIEQARAFVKDCKVEAYYEQVLLGALRLAQADAERGRMDDVRLENVFKTVSDIVEDLAEFVPEKKPRLSALKDQAPDQASEVVPLPNRTFGKSVFCVPGLGRLDDCAVLVVADTLKRSGIDGRVASATALEDDRAPWICICYLENVSQARLDYAVRKISKRSPSAEVVACLLGGANPLESPSSQTYPLARTLTELPQCIEGKSAAKSPMPRPTS